MLYFPKGMYTFARPIVVYREVVIMGDEAVNYPDTPTTLIFTQQNTAGLKILTKSSLKHLKVMGARGTPPDPEADGIYCPRSSFLYNLDVQEFGGTGVYLDASAFFRYLTTDPVLRLSEGLILDIGAPTVFSGYTDADVVRGCLLTDHNADHAVIERVRARDCNLGFHVIGDKANTMTFLHCDASSNDREGVREQSALGNTWIMPHMSVDGTGQALNRALWFPGVSGAQIGEASTNGVTGGTIEIVSASAFPSAYDVGARIWTDSMRAVAGSTGETGDSDLAGPTGYLGGLIVWRSADGTRLRYFDVNFFNWSPSFTFVSYSATSVTGPNQINFGSAPTGITTGAYVALSGGLSAANQPLRVTAVVGNSIQVDGTVTGSTGTVTLRSRFFSSVTDAKAYIAPAFHIPDGSDSNRSRILGSYTETNSYSPAINGNGALIWASAGGAVGQIRGGTIINTSGGGRWSVDHDNIGQHAPGQSVSGLGSVGPMTFWGPYIRACFGFSAQHDNGQGYLVSYNPDGSSTLSPYWYFFRHGNITTTSATLRVLALGGNYSEDVTGTTSSGYGRAWIFNGLYLGNTTVELSAALRITGATYRCSLFRDVTGARSADYEDDNTTSGYSSHALSWGSAAPSGNPSSNRNNWHPGDLVFGTGIVSGGPAAWICSQAGVVSSSASTFGQIWASLGGNLYLGSASPNSVTAVVIGAGNTSSAAPAATLRGTDGASGAGGDLLLRAGDGVSGNAPGGSMVIRGGDAAGSNQAGGALALRGGRSTGSGAGGAVTVETAPAGTLIERVRINTDGEVYHRGNGVASGEGVHRQTFRTSSSNTTPVTAWSLALNSGETVWVTVTITMRRTSNNDSGMRVIYACAKQIAGSASLTTGSPNTPFTLDDSAFSDATIDTSGASVRLRVNATSATQVEFDGEVVWQVLV